MPSESSEPSDDLKSRSVDHTTVCKAGHAKLKGLQLIRPELFQIEGKWPIEAF
jgi:hypothetical protein